MKSFLQLLTLAGFLSLAAACNPDDPSTSPPPSAADTALSGYLVCNKVYAGVLYGESDTTWEEDAEADFFATPGDTSSLVGVDSVTINSYPTDGSENNYIAFVGGGPGAICQINDSAVWRVYSSTASVPSFLYNDTAPYPEFSSGLPDTVSKSVGYTLYLPTGADSVSVFDGAHTDPFNYTSGNIPASITVTPAMLASLDTNSGVEIIIFAGVRHFATFNGKKYLFGKVVQKIQTAWLTP